VSGRGALRVLVTRPVGPGADALAERLLRRGFDAVHVPLIAIAPAGDDPIDLSAYDWVVVTSPNGARELLRRASGALPRRAAIGQATAEALGGADVVAAVSTQEGLLAAMPPHPGRVLLAGAAEARELLPLALNADVLVLYHTRPLVPAAPLAGDLVTLASASAAGALGALGAPSSAIPSVSIGPETTRAAEAAGVNVVAEAERHDLDGLVEAVARAAL
jgi:uroporphyrinogen III methyltransferase / synthase